MASWTDAITQFNPYVSTLPVEAMVKVGMEKQRRYDEGYAKIQAQIDQVAGLDVIRDVDKNYLQSKLNELGGRLQTFAASDFSNYQLVNSVAGMAKQVGSDETVQNAVASTAHYKGQLKRMEEARKKGKSDKNNEDFFYNDANKWLSDKNAGAKFSGSFTEHVDIMKTIRENVTAAGVDSKYIEQIYETDANGNILRDKNNHPIPARVMATESLDTNAEKVKSIVANVMSQGDIKQQLYIDGWANTRNTPVESIYQTFENDFQERDSTNNQQLLFLQSQLDSTNLTSEQKEQISNQINGIKEVQDLNRKKLDGLRKMSVENPEQFKIDYYQDGYVSNLIDGFTTIKSKKEVKDSPLKKQLNWEEDMDFKRNKEAFDRKIALATAGRDARRLQLEEMKFDADYEFDPVTGRYKKVETADSSKKKPVNTTTTSEINAENKGEPIDAVSSYKSVTSDLQSQAQLKGFDLIYTYLYKLNNGVTKDGKPFTKENAKNDINAWAKSNGETPYQFIIRFSADLKNKSELNGIKLSVQDAEKIDEISKLHNDITTRLAVTDDAYRQAKAETGIDVSQFSNLFTPINTTDIYNRPTQVTVQDQVDYAFLKGKTPVVRTPEEKTAYERLVKKYGDDAFLNLKHMFLKNGIDPNKYVKLGESSSSFRKAMDIVSEKFQKVNVVSDNFSATLSGSDEEIKAAKGRLIPLFNAERLEESDQQAIAAVLAESGGLITYDAKRPIKEGEPWTGTIYVTDKKGKKHSVEVDQANLEIITGREFRPYVEDGLAARARISQFGSTNLGAFTTDPNAYTTAAINSNRFSSLKNSDYTAYADIMPLSGGKLGVTIYAKDKTMSKFERIEMVPIKTNVNNRPVYFYDYNEIAGVVPNITAPMIANELNKLKQK